MKLPTLRLRHCVVRMHGRSPSLGWSFEFAFSTLRVKSQQSAIHELIHRTIPLLSDSMNALSKSIQDDYLRFSPGLFLSGTEESQAQQYSGQPPEAHR